MNKITYDNKETINPQPSLANKNKVSASDMNEIKNCLNAVIDTTTYSTNEIVVGTWIDGKPLYRKTIYSTTATGSLNTTNIDFLRWKNFNTFVDNKFLFPDARYINSTDKLDFYAQKADGTFGATFGSSWDTKFNYLVFDIEYTKTTD